jgi:hypothetical protein
MQRLHATVGKEVAQLYDPDDGISFDTGTRFARTGAGVACTQGHLSALRSDLSTSLHWSSGVFLHGANHEVPTFANGPMAAARV